MKIIIEPQIFNDQEFGGISRYYSEIYKGLKKHPKVSFNLPLLHTENLHIKDSVNNEMNLLNKFLIKNNIFKRKVLRRLKRHNKRNILNQLKKRDYDLVIPTYYDTYFLEHIGKKPFVLTVYDMIHEIFPQYFDETDDTSKRKKILIEKATRIIAVSQNTKRDILNFFPHIDENIIDVIYHGHSDQLHLEQECPYLPKRYLLYVGNRHHYKNFHFFLESIQNLLKEDNTLYAFFAGGYPFREDEQKFIDELGIRDKLIQYKFNDNELNSIYKNALCFVFPSEYEGFGIPVLESMSNSCPIILPKHSSFPEVAGDAGIFYELNNHKDLEQKIRLTIENPEFKKKHIALGLEQVKKFSWKEASLQCLETYKKAIKNE